MIETAFNRLIVPVVLVCVVFATTDVQAQGRNRAGRYGRNNSQMKSVTGQLIPGFENSVCKVSSGGAEILLGTIVSEDGLVVTKNSDVVYAGALECELASGERVSAKIVASDSSYDLALLRLDTTGLQPVALATGEDAESEISAGTIVVSPDHRGQPISMGLISVDPRRFSMRQRRIAQRGYLGIECREQDEGLTIRRITDRSGAERAGLERGDVILKCDDQEITTTDSLISLLAGRSPGDTIRLQVKRDDDDAMEINARLGEDPGGVDRSRDQWGGGPFSARRFGFPEVISHDSVIRPEQCGGPLIDSSGQLIGINIARALRVSTYAVPTAVVKNFVDNNRNAGLEPDTGR